MSLLRHVGAIDLSCQQLTYVAIVALIALAAIVVAGVLVRRCWPRRRHRDDAGDRQGRPGGRGGVSAATVPRRWRSSRSSCSSSCSSSRPTPRR